MKKTIITTLGLLLILVLSSSKSNQIQEPRATPMVSCGPPANIYLVKAGTGKPLFPGQHKLFPNTTYKVWGVGGVNVAYMCVSVGSGYTIMGSGCEDFAPGDERIIGTIVTASTIQPGITINIGSHCYESNGTWTSWTGGYSYAAY
ncbi:MAG: hypothetical protein ACOYXT_27265 [Bacteroidota bacterium]